MAPESFFVIHNAWTGVVGDAAKMRKIADDLDTVNESLVETYCSRARPGAVDKETVRNWMNAETWIGAEKALEIAWADTIETGAQRMAASLADKGRLKHFKNVPSELGAAHSAVQDNELWFRRKQLDLI